jgi:RNA polymerase sigma-70 factor (ECF subfamily)
MKAPSAIALRDLLKRIKEGDRQAAVQLFALLGEKGRFGTAILTMARRLLPRAHSARRLADSDDIVQSAIHTGLRNVSRFKGETEGEFYAWFRRILRTKVNRITRRKSHRVLRDEALNLQEIKVDPATPPLATIVDEELRERLQMAIADLDGDQRVVVELRLSGFSSSDIGQILNLTPATVRKRESRAVEKLKAHFAPLNWTGSSSK